MPIAAVPPSGKGPLSLLRTFPRTAGWVLVLLFTLSFHRPVLRLLLGRALQVSAANQGLLLKTRIRGNMLTECVFEELLVEPRPDARSPIERLYVHKAILRYNLLRLLLSTSDHGLNSVMVRDADLKLTPGEKGAADQASLQRTVSNWSGILVRLPIFWTERIRLSNINISAQNASSGFILRGASLSAAPGAEGALEIQSLSLSPNVNALSLKASISYDHRRLVLKGLRLSPALTLEHVQLDAPSRAEGIARLELDGICGEGHFSALLETGRAHWLVQAAATGIKASSLKEWTGAAADTLPDLVAAQIHFGGQPTKSETWKGELRVECEKTMLNRSRASFEVEGLLQHGVFTLTSLKGESAASRLSGGGTISLSKATDSIAKMRAEGQIQFESANIGEWNLAPGSPHFEGSVKGSAKLKLSPGGVQLDLQAFGDALTAGFWRATHCQIDASVSSPIQGFGALENIAGNAVISLKQPGYDGGEVVANAEEGAFAVTLDTGTARLWNIVLKDSANVLAGEVSLPLRAGTLQPSGSLRVTAENLSAAKLRWRGHSFGGALEASWNGSVENGMIHGGFNGSGKSLSWGAFGLDKIRASGTVEGGGIQLQEGAIEWSPAEWVRVTGTMHLGAPDRSSFTAEARVPNLARVSPLLEQLGLVRSKLSGGMEGHWKGNGFLGSKAASGEWSVLLKQARWEQVNVEVLECAGRYVSDAGEVFPLRFSTKSTKFSAQIEWKAGALRCTKIALEQWGHPTLNGEFVLPITFDHRGFRWVEHSEISGHLRAEKLDLNTLLSVNGAPSPLLGTVQMALSLGGQPANPLATFRCNATGLKPVAAAQFGSSNVILEGRYDRGSLSANLTAATPLQGSITMNAALPLPLADLFSGKISIGDLPLQAKFQAKSLNLSSLPNLLPGIRKTSGSATLDLRIEGTLRTPIWLGRLEVDCPLLHFASDRLPAVGGLSIVADFSEKELRLNRLKADLGGGNLEILGTASFATPGDPILDFKAKAHEVLAVRNPKLALRLNGELSLRGPFKHAEISGAVSPTKSRVQRDIEVLPLNVLRMEVPRDTRTAGKPWFTFRKAPFSEWSFNVEMRTTKGDPLLLRGNRLRGSMEAEMRLEGTGATPTLHGAYRSNDLIATLPFAQIELSRGRIWYTRDQPFQPHIDFSAETEVRNHRIRLYLYGPAAAPHITANSEPPEPEPDLLTLIATGTLPSDSSDRSQTLANRAAAVLFQEFSDKVLPTGDRERFSALRRFNLDLGAINNRSGQQETRLTYRVMDDLSMIGEIRPGGDFAARVRYLFRFR